MADDCYVYEHWRPDLGEPFYVGKGRKNRAYELAAYRRNRHHLRIQAKLAQSGLSVEVRLVAEELSEEEAFEAEYERVLFWRAHGVILTNMSDGGEGGRNPSQEVRAKLSKIHKGKTLSPEHKAAFCRGRKKPADRLKPKRRLLSKEERRASLMASWTPERRAAQAAVTRQRLEKMQAARRARGPHEHSDETKRVLSEKIKGSKFPPRSAEWSERLSRAWTPERRAAQAARIAAENRRRARVVDAHTSTVEK